MDAEEENATDLTDICLFEGRNYSCCVNRYNIEESIVQNVAMIVDGPITFFAALLALVGGHYAIKFLRQAGLNKDLTAALYTLAICDTILILACIFYHSIEATSLLIFGDNLMWNHQQTVLITYGAVNAATTASTLLVVIITFQRFFVVWWPLKYASLQDRSQKPFNLFKTVIRMATETVGPIFTISFITIITEHKVYTSLQARRKLFESQHRRRSVILLEELKEKVSRAVAIFIAIKFIILRSLPVFFDLNETINGIDSFGTAISILVRISDFGVVLNSATNSLAYFGRKQWLENRLKGRLLRKCFGSSDKSCPSEKLLIQDKRNSKSAGSVTREDVMEGDSV
uniref:G_PROTEIN_RECEP_F1_2 domain-containing protein n=1 Tax=Panagrellus redivivus TaxID=6233 RepID=A0A7E4W363_PANRE